jgi:putative nucleotidyltransferase with HDIG domain
VRLLQAVAGVLTGAIGRPRAQDAHALTALCAGAQRLSGTLDQQRLAQDIVTDCVESFGVRVAWLGCARPDGTVQALAHHPPEAEYPRRITARWDDSPEGRGAAGRAIRAGIPAIIPDLAHDPDPPPWRPQAMAAGLRSAGAFPLISRDRAFGALGLYSDEPGFFTPERVEFFQTYAHLVAAALENARLYDAAERRLQQLQALRDIDLAISGSLDLRLTLAVFLENVTAQLRVDAADVLLLNPHMQTLDYGAGRGFRTAALQHTHLRLGEGHAGRAALRRRTVAVRDLRSDPGDFPRTPLLVSEGFLACIAVPLVAKGHVKGILEIFHRAPLTTGREWQDFLEALAGQAAIAIDNAELFDGLQRSHTDLALAYDTTLEGWSRALDLRDKETEGHTRRVAEMAIRLARTMGLPEDELVHLRRGALLHDIGKMAIPDSILLKPGPLTDEEWEVMRRHPTYAYEMLSPIAYLRPAIDVPYCHHEKWDGTGYPRGLHGEQIPLAARVFAIADVWDALRSDRPYRPAWPEERIRAYIREEAGRHFDPRIAEMFVRLVPPVSRAAARAH